MSAIDTYRIKAFGFRFSQPETTRIFEADQISYRIIERNRSFRIGAENNFVYNESLHIEFIINLGLLYQQLNAGVAYQLSSGGSVAAAAATTPAQILDRLISVSAGIWFYPLIDRGGGTIDLSTNYKVKSNNSSIMAMAAERGGWLASSYPVRMITEVPLTNYPTWINR